MSQVNEQDSPSVWCLVANVRDLIPFGEGGRETRHGTRLLRAGAKVHCYPPKWGDGYQKIKVIARHRKSSRWITTVIPCKSLTHFRAKRIYDPVIVRKMGNEWGDGEHARRYAEAAAAWPADQELESLGETFGRTFGEPRTENRLSTLTRWIWSRLTGRQSGSR